MEKETQGLLHLTLFGHRNFSSLYFITECYHLALISACYILELEPACCNCFIQTTYM